MWKMINLAIVGLCLQGCWHQTIVTEGIDVDFRQARAYPALVYPQTFDPIERSHNYDIPDIPDRRFAPSNLQPPDYMQSTTAQKMGS